MTSTSSPLPVRLVILAGGQGTRFWPISRKAKPKQFLSLSENGESLLQATVRHTQDVYGTLAPIIVTNHLHSELVKEHVPHGEIIVEPVARNTAASIGLAAIAVRKQHGDAVMIVRPADHYVGQATRLTETLQKAVALASEHEVLVTLGITPEYANTGYGYIRRGIPLNGSGYMVRRFFEKPNYERALEYSQSADYYWNSGIFIWRASVILEAIEEHMPQLYAGLLEIEKHLGSPDFVKDTAPIFEHLENISIDFGILELARNCAVVPANNIEWNDVGSWDAWASQFQKDSEGNLLHGEAVAFESKNCVVYSQNRFFAVLGADDLVVIDGGDAVLVCPRHRVQDVKKIVEWLNANGKSSLT